jgi:hypothetical protein
MATFKKFWCGWNCNESFCLAVPLSGLEHSTFCGETKANVREILHEASCHSNVKE